MSRPPATNSVDLNDIFKRVQRHMLAHFACGQVFDHPTIAGAACERSWIEILSSYLPQRYAATPAFIVDADGRRSRQIDIAVYDQLYSPLIFPHQSGVHVPAESVYAVFEVKTNLTKPLVLDAGRKAASVRALRRTSAPIFSAGVPRPPIPPNHILAGVLALGSNWPTRFEKRLSATLVAMPPIQRLDLGCVLQQGAFEILEPKRRPRPAPVPGPGPATTPVAQGSHPAADWKSAPPTPCIHPHPSVHARRERQKKIRDTPRHHNKSTTTNQHSRVPNCF